MAHDAAQKRLRLAAPFEPHHVSSLMIVDLLSGISTYETEQAG
jgi:hypothetical protein